MIWLLLAVELALFIGPPVAAIFVCHIAHERIYEYTGSRIKAIFLGMIVGMILGAVVSAGPLVLWTMIAGSLGKFDGNDGWNVASIFTMMLAVLGALIGLIFGGGVWLRIRK